MSIKKIYKYLTPEQKAKGIIFTSTLSEHTTEQSTDTIHKVYRIIPELEKTDLHYYNKEMESNKRTIELLKDNRFFNKSNFKYNIIRE